MVDFITPVIVVVILVALVAIVNAWVIGSADRSFFELIVKMPKFVEKPDATLADYEAPLSPGEKPGMIETYHNLRLYMFQRCLWSTKAGLCSRYLPLRAL